MMNQAQVTRIYETSPSHHFPFNTFTKPSLAAPDFAPFRAFRVGVGSAGSMGTMWPDPSVSNGVRSSSFPVSFLSRFVGPVPRLGHPSSPVATMTGPKYHSTRY